ncbi:PLD nuclease N-terminal domain-containing protein [Beggiatoa leptomitoformis]|uniref:Cardiolipin synthase N-terminal domain-containing protein n=1 Tax=Beggiatoa leptomitoformis TaxID=288004 RepID=A0A2N9YCW5_9GAMM|nr:PLD nuclease N-terminal domain-containing protein [Beggiatoa leptomitoformis]AUI68276.1 hypothetical protein BLE401_05895 [Beggiatoa leptomitoformis]QGX03428.1 hypothetical protein AL038_18190 [Beggiatoa leptomitoformis]
MEFLEQYIDFFFTPFSLALLFIIFYIILWVNSLIDCLSSRFEGTDKLIWLLALICFPFFGLLLYIFIGKKQRIKSSSQDVFSQPKPYSYASDSSLSLFAPFGYVLFIATLILGYFFVQASYQELEQQTAIARALRRENVDSQRRIEAYGAEINRLSNIVKYQQNKLVSLVNQIDSLQSVKPLPIQSTVQSSVQQSRPAVSSSVQQFDSVRAFVLANIPVQSFTEQEASYLSVYIRLLESAKATDSYSDVVRHLFSIGERLHIKFNRLDKAKPYYLGSYMISKYLCAQTRNCAETEYIQKVQALAKNFNFSLSASPKANSNALLKCEFEGVAYFYSEGQKNPCE